MRQRPHENTSDDYVLSRKLRNEASPVEKKLWRELSVQSAARGLKFRRQQVIHPYVADFACLAARVLVEIDGVSHDSRECYDKKREAFLQRQGYSVMRFANKEAVENTGAVVETILNFTEEKLSRDGLDNVAPLPNPPREGEGTTARLREGRGNV